MEMMTPLQGCSSNRSSEEEENEEEIEIEKMK
jgi:hypothetical protein